MLILGVDTHKRTHTIVAVDEHGRQVAQRTITSTSDDHLELVAWAKKLDDERTWAVGLPHDANG